MDFFNEKQLSLLQIDPLENASLETLLSNKSLPLLELLSINQMQTKIRSNFTFFIKHCQKNEDFCFNLIDIAIKCPMHLSASENMKQACYIATDALTCDQDIVADLLILPDKSNAKKKNQSGDESEQFQEIEENIETEHENLAGPPEIDLVDQSMSQEQRFNRKYKYLNRVLEYILQNETKNLDENCINYMIKSLNCLVRKKADQFLEFFQKKHEILKKLIQINNFSSVNQFLIKILSDDDIQAQSSQQIKKIIIEGVLNKLLSSVNSQDFAQRLDFLDQLFQTNKYASEDDRTQLQKLSDVFSSKETIQFFYEHLVNPKSPAEFFNCICYLSIIVKRMNVDEEIDPYSYSNEEREETMIFEIDVLFKEFPKILVQGYQNLLNTRYPQEYKQRIMQTKFYEFLILLTKNSRLSNCSGDIKHGALTDMKGDNIIFQNQEKKISILKELLKQFSTQSRSGLNRINIISLIQKVLNVQIYREANHSNALEDVENKQVSQNQNEVKEVEKEHQTPQQIIQEHQKIGCTSHVQEETDAEEKKKKINKIKAGLKLNIKKFSLQHFQSEEKTPQPAQVPNKKEQESANVRKLQSSLKKAEVLEILQFFSELLKTNTEFNKPGAKNKFRNNQNEIYALVNKLIVIFCDSVWWSAENVDVLNKEKDDFINQVQTIFPSFSFEEISRNYSTTLATSKHPNASAKEKTNPELNFSSEFFRIYSKKKDIVQKSKQSSGKNLELSDSDFKSDDNEEDMHAVKCTLQEFKKFTGFKFQDEKGPKSINAPPTERTMVEEPKITNSEIPTQVSNSELLTQVSKEDEAPIIISNVNGKIPIQILNGETSAQKKDSFILKQKELQEQTGHHQEIKINGTQVQSPKSQNKEEKLPIEINSIKEPIQEQKKEKVQHKEQIKEETKLTNKNKQKVDEEIPIKKIPSQFYIKHRMIFV